MVGVSKAAAVSLEVAELGSEVPSWPELVGLGASSPMASAPWTVAAPSARAPSVAPGAATRVQVWTCGASYARRPSASMMGRFSRGYASFLDKILCTAKEVHYEAPLPFLAAHGRICDTKTHGVRQLALRFECRIRVARRWFVEDYSGWLTKEEACVRLNMSKRTLERAVELEQIRKAWRSVPGLRPIVVHNPDDIEAIAKAQSRRKQRRRSCSVANHVRSATWRSCAKSLPHL